MKKLVLSFALFATAAFAGEWTGTISDAMCGAKHADASAKSAACVKACIKRGSKPVLVSDGKVINIANPNKVDVALEGAKVKVTGDMKGDTLTIATIEAEK